jgi:hypothetical protein
MSTVGEIMLNAINNLSKYDYNSVEYFNVKDLMLIKEYSKGANSSQDRLIKKKKFSEESRILGRISLDEKTINVDNVVSKKFTKKFVMASEVLKEFSYLTKDENDGENDEENDRDNKSKWIIHEQRPLIKAMDNDFYYFKDKSGVKYNVEMRGERTKDGILFKCKDLEKVFYMNRLCDTVTNKANSFKELDDFLYCKDPFNQGNVTDKTLYLTFSGLTKVIHNSRTGRAKEFANWLDDIVFAAIVGDEEQRKQSAEKVMNVDLQALVRALSKCSGKVSCLYLLKTGIKQDNKSIYKFGLTKHLDQRIREHVSTFGDDLKLSSYCLIGESDLYAAEKMLKESVEDFLFKSKEDKFKCQIELIILDTKSKKHVKQTMELISMKFCSDSNSIISGIKLEFERELSECKRKLNEKESEIMKLKLESEHKVALHEKELVIKDKIIEIKEQEIKTLNQELDNEKLKAELANMKHLMSIK